MSRIGLGEERLLKAETQSLDSGTGAKHKADRVVTGPGLARV